MFRFIKMKIQIGLRVRCIKDVVYTFRHLGVICPGQEREGRRMNSIESREKLAFHGAIST